MPRQDLISLRSDTAANWAAAETSGPALAAGENALVDGVLVTGDGTTKVAGLPRSGSGTYARGLNLFFPENYGAGPTYSTGTDDTTAVQAAFTAASASGGRVWLSRLYNTPAGGITATGRVDVCGIGGTLSNDGDATPGALSGLRVNATTGDALTLTQIGSVLMDFAVINHSGTTPTAGAGIRSTAFSQAHMERVTVVGFYDNVAVGGVYYTITNCHIYDPVRYGLRVTTTNPDYYDHGDFGVLNNVITSLWKAYDASAAIHWEAGGGMRVGFNKINGATGGGSPVALANGRFARGIEVLVGDAVNTVDILVQNNKISNCSNVGIYVDQMGPAYTGVVAGCQMSGNGIDACDYGIIVKRRATGTTKDIVIGQNFFTGITNQSIIVDGAFNVLVEPNLHREVGSAVQIESGTADVQVMPQMVYDKSKVLLRDNSADDYTSHAGRGLIQHEYARAIPSTTSTSTYTTLWRITPASYASGVMELVITGQVTNVGASTVKAVRTYVRNSVSGVVTVATVGTDVAVGTVIDILFDTAAVTGEVHVKLRLNAGAGGADFTGRATLRIDGVVRQVYIDA